jgi:hypothetical protein
MVTQAHDHDMTRDSDASNPGPKCPADSQSSWHVDHHAASVRFTGKRWLKSNLHDASLVPVIIGSEAMSHIAGHWHQFVQVAMES